MGLDTPLVCLACRTRDGDTWHVHTLSWEGSPPVGEGDGVLACAHCGRRYPVVAGIPIVVPDLAAHLARESFGVYERDIAPATAALLALAGDDDAPHARSAEILSIYLDAHWGDRAEPPPDGPSAPGLQALAAKLRARAAEPVERAIDLGASVGRAAAELARGARTVVALDRSLSLLRRARRLLAGDAVTYLRRAAGRHYVEARATAERPVGGVEWVCGDALDPPFVPGSFQRVVLLNLIDVVHHPGQLLDVVGVLCAPGGEVILSSPYNWQTGTVGEEHRLGGADPAAAVVARLRGAGFTVEDEDELPWALRRDARSAVLYRAHYVRARKD